MNNIIEKISKKYEGHIKLYEPAQIIPEKIPQALAEILRESNGIMDVTPISSVNFEVEIGWIIYPCKMMIEATEFFRSEYQLDGVVFADDGAGNPYYIKSGGSIYMYECIDGEEIIMSNSLNDFFTA